MKQTTMARRRIMLGVILPSVMVCAWLIAFVMLPELRRAVAEPIVGQAGVHGTMHFNTPIEEIHNWLAPPVLRE